MTPIASLRSAGSRPNPRSERGAPMLYSRMQLVDHLANLCQQGCTGYLYFVSADQHAGSFVLRSGEIIAIRYACQRGLAALKLLQHQPQSQRPELQWCSCRFVAKKASTAEDPELPRTQTLLLLLGWSHPLKNWPDQTAPRVLPPAQPRPAQPRPAQPRPAQHRRVPRSVQLSAQLSVQQWASITELLTHYLGPVAPFVVNQATRQTQNFEEVTALLAAKIPQASDAQAFRSQMRAYSRSRLACGIQGDAAPRR